MKISTKGRYALRLMIDLAQHKSEDAWIPLKDISRRQGVSVKYLEQIIHGLTTSGMVSGLRGPTGGYRLTQDTNTCTAGDILRAIEGNLAPVTCLESSPNHCDRYATCPAVKFWEGLHKTIIAYVVAITLADLAKDAAAFDPKNFTCMHKT